MNRTLRRFVGLVLVTTALVACGSGSDSGDRDRNVEAGFTCAQGGACVLGDVGPGGGTVFVPADKGGTAWEAAPLNGYGSYEDATVLVRQLDFGAKTDWVLPPDTVIDDLWAQRARFACAADTDCPNVFADGAYWAQGKNAESASVWSFATGTQVQSENEDEYYFRPVRAIVIAGAATTTAAAATTSTPTTTTTTTTLPRTTTTAATAPSGRKCKVSYSSYLVEFCAPISQASVTFVRGGVDVDTMSWSYYVGAKIKTVRFTADRVFTSLRISATLQDGSRLTNVMLVVASTSSGDAEFALS